MRTSKSTFGSDGRFPWKLVHFERVTECKIDGFGRLKTRQMNPAGHRDGLKMTRKSMDSMNVHEFGYREMNILLENFDLDTIEAKNGTSSACFVNNMSRVIDVSTETMKIDAMFCQNFGHGAEYASGRG